MGNKKTVLLADDQSSIRSLIKTVVDSLGGEVVGEAENGSEAVSKYKLLKPDLVLLDINMPIMDGVEALGQIMAENPAAAVAMLTSQNTTEVIKKCAGSGAKYFVLKTSPESIAAELKKLF